MKIRIYPKVRWLDDLELDKHFIPNLLTKRSINEINNLISENPSDYSDKLEKLLKKYNILFNRDDWSDLEFSFFLDYMELHFAPLLQIVKKDCIEATISKQSYRNYMYVFDHQIYNTKTKIWYSGNKSIDLT